MGMNPLLARSSPVPRSRRCRRQNELLLGLCRRLRERGFRLFDIQFLTEHTERLGAVEIPRREYLRRLREALAVTPWFGD